VGQAQLLAMPVPCTFALDVRTIHVVAVDPQSPCAQRNPPHSYALRFRQRMSHRANGPLLSCAQPRGNLQKG
jgi:hypothetical protein